MKTISAGSSAASSAGGRGRGLEQARVRHLERRSRRSRPSRTVSASRSSAITSAGSAASIRARRSAGAQLLGARQRHRADPPAREQGVHPLGPVARRCVITTSPARTPRAASAPASRAARSSTSPKVSSVREPSRASATSAVRDGSAAPTTSSAKFKPRALAQPVEPRPQQLHRDRHQPLARHVLMVVPPVGQRLGGAHDHLGDHLDRLVAPLDVHGSVLRPGVLGDQLGDQRAHAHRHAVEHGRRLGVGGLAEEHLPGAAALLDEGEDRVEARLQARRRRPGPGAPAAATRSNSSPAYISISETCSSSFDAKCS